MFHLFHLGPALVGERRQWLLCGVNEEGGFTHPLVGPDLPSGLAMLSARYGPAKLRVEPALEAVAAPFGIPVEPLPERALTPRAAIAFAFSSFQALFRMPSVVASFLEACAEFEKAAPWARLGSGQPLEMLLTRSWRCWRRELVVRGAGGDARGIELHPVVERDRLARLSALRRPRSDSLLVTFEPGPPWAIEALRSAYGLGELPTVIRLKPGSGSRPEPLELLELAAALRSAALLGSEEASPNHGAQVSLGADRWELHAVTTPPAGAQITRLPSAEISRNALCPCGSGQKFKRCHLTTNWLAPGRA
jgi:hypothetical protein